jgi:hypothetical protein
MATRTCTTAAARRPTAFAQTTVPRQKVSSRATPRMGPANQAISGCIKPPLPTPLTVVTPPWIREYHSPKPRSPLPMPVSASAAPSCSPRSSRTKRVILVLVHRPNRARVPPNSALETRSTCIAKTQAPVRAEAGMRGSVWCFREISSLERRRQDGDRSTRRTRGSGTRWSLIVRRH